MRAAVWGILMNVDFLGMGVATETGSMQEAAAVLDEPNLALPLTDPGPLLLPGPIPVRIVNSAGGLFQEYGKPILVAVAIAATLSILRP